MMALMNENVHIMAFMGEKSNLIKMKERARVNWKESWDFKTCSMHFYKK